MLKTISKIVSGENTSDGAGVKLKRIIGTRTLLQIDPFMLLDEFKNEHADDYSAGFPPHPHRGFETVTYMLEGNFRHEDSRGNVGELGPGSVQWMTAGKGIVHSEMPMQNEGRIWGFQLWVNLPKKLKWIEPSYHDMHSKMIPEHIEPHKKVRVIAGEYMGKKSIHTSAIPFQYYDVHLQNSETFKTQISVNHTTLLYVYQGELQIESKSEETNSKIIQESHLALFSEEGDEVCVAATSAQTRFIFLSSRNFRR
jgi:redox-sensitive bicupin YhaK (pirin superfamily)